MSASTHIREISTGRIYASTPHLEKLAREFDPRQGPRFVPCDAKGRPVVVDVPWTWTDPEQDLDAAITEGLAAGLSLAEIARRQGVDKSTVSRHARRQGVDRE